jgi:hypothetical protein
MFLNIFKSSVAGITTSLILDTTTFNTLPPTYEFILTILKIIAPILTAYFTQVHLNKRNATKDAEISDELPK